MSDLEAFFNSLSSLPTEQRTGFMSQIKEYIDKYTSIADLEFDLVKYQLQADISAAEIIGIRLEAFRHFYMANQELLGFTDEEMDAKIKDIDRASTDLMFSRTYMEDDLTNFENMRASYITATINEVESVATNSEMENIGMPDRIKALNDRKADLQKRIDSINEQIESIQSDIKKYTAEVATNEEALRTAEGDLEREVSEAGYDYDEIIETSAEDISNDRVRAAKELYDGAKSKLEKSKSTLSQLQTSSEESLGEKTTYSKNIDTIISEMNEIGDTMKKVTKSEFADALKTFIDKRFKPASDFLSQAGRTRDLLMGGYKDLQEFLVDSNNAIKYIGEYDKAIRGHIDKETSRMIDDLNSVKDMFGEEIDEAVLSNLSKFISPSWRMYASMKTEVMDFINGFKESLFKDFFRTIAGGVVLLIRTLLKGAMAVASRIAELIFGTLVTDVVVELTTSAAKLVFAAAEVMLSNEVQAIFFAIRGIVDAFKVHNVAQWVDDMIHLVAGGVFDRTLPMMLLKISEYPEVSGPGKPDSDKGKGFEGFLMADYKELKFALDFWGSHYIKARILEGLEIDDYKELPDFEGQYRVPGRYIDLKNHPYHNQQEVDKCIELENSIDAGTLVDQSGYLTGIDKGAFGTSILIHRKKDKVRNLLSFPLYENGFAWPDRDGEYFQTKGFFSEHDVDPTIVTLLENMAKSGEWGEIYNNPKSTPEIKKQAAETNKKDYDFFIKPSLDDPLAWSKLKHWADSNKGKIGLVSQDFNGLNAETILAEMGSDYLPGEEDWIRQEGGDTYDAFIDNMSNFLQTVEAQEIIYSHMGRFSLTKGSMKFFERLQTEGKIYYIPNSGISIGTAIEIGLGATVIGGPAFGVIGVLAYAFTNIISGTVQSRKPTKDEIARYEPSFLRLYEYAKETLGKPMAELTKWKGSFETALWDVYTKSTSKRTTWDYIRMHQTSFVLELQVLTYAHSTETKKKLLDEFEALLKNKGVPLNMNRYNRLAYCAKFSSYIYKQGLRKGEIEDQITAVGGRLLENILITTGIQPTDTWSTTIRNIVLIGQSQIDMPLYFGNLHCRIMVIEKPNPTCFIVFRGTTNFWEWTIDMDFMGADYGSIKKKDDITWILETFGGEDSTYDEMKDIIFKDPTYFALHNGFFRAWTGFKPKVLEALKTIYKKYHLHDMIVTGHSLGAAVAQIACLEIPSYSRIVGQRDIPGLGPEYEYQNARPHAYLFSSPNVGDHRFDWYFKSMTGESAHAFIDGDMVTTLPLFLMPRSATWGGANISSYFNLLNDILSSETGEYATLYEIFKKIFNGISVPKLFQKDAWMTNGKLDFKKISKNSLSLAVAHAKHTAIKGGEAFIRLSDTTSGNFIESPTDPGISGGFFSNVPSAITDITKTKKVHNIDELIQGLDIIAKAHPDLFSELVDGHAISWDDVGVKNNDINPIGTLADIPTGKILGTCRLTKNHPPFTKVDMNNVKKHTIAKHHDVTELKRKMSRQQTRVKQRRIMEGEYHGY
jgi:predicted  nucleic acid-binding Zn-ribbon protein